MCTLRARNNPLFPSKDRRFGVGSTHSTGMSVAEIHRRTGRDPKTIRRIRDQAEPVTESVAEPTRPRKLDPFKAYVLESG